MHAPVHVRDVRSVVNSNVSSSVRIARDSHAFSSRCTGGSDPGDFVASDDYPTCETGALDVNTLGNMNAQTAGSLVALCVSGIIAFIVALFKFAF